MAETSLKLQKAPLTAYYSRQHSHCSMQFTSLNIFNTYFYNCRVIQNILKQTFRKKMYKHVSGWYAYASLYENWQNWAQMTALIWYTQTPFTNHSIPLEPDIMVYKLAFYIRPTAHMFFLNIWTYFDFNKSTFQKFIRKNSHSHLFFTVFFKLFIYTKGRLVKPN